MAAAGVALSVFNTASKLLSVPLLAITTSSVAQALGSAEQQGEWVGTTRCLVAGIGP